MSEQQFDELTGALGRAGFSRRLEVLQLQYAESGRDFAVAMIDVDHLKTINDVYGHQAGDATIRTVAQRAMHVLRSSDLLFRYGGDEFVVLLPGTSHAEATAILRRVRSNIVNSPVDAGQSLTVTVSMGVAASTEQNDGDAADTLLRADRRLLQAKRAGRNSLVAEDRPAADRQGTNFAEARLYGRDLQLGQADGFLDSSPTSSRERVLQVTGLAGVGLSRFLQEIGVRAGLAGRAVRHLQVEPAHSSLHLRALEMAYSDEISADASAEALATRLRNDAETHGLVVLLEGGNLLDPMSRQLLAERLHREGTWLVEAVRDGQQPVFPAGTSMELEPLVRRDALAWLGAATAGPIEAATGSALLLAGKGLPGRLQALVRDLMVTGDLRKSPAGLSGRPEVIAERARQLDEQAERRTPKLPGWDTPLVGRNQFLELIRPTAHSSRLLVLTGPGGIGKSRLAAQLALELAGQSALEVDWIDLRAVTEADRLPGLVSSALELEPVEELDQLVPQLSGTSRLLVFDEADGIAGSAAVFGELLAGLPDLRLVVTSRMPLRLAGETVVEVPELGASAAVELFQQGVLRQGGPTDAGIARVDDLLQAIGHAPLSIELAAAWTRVFSPAELAEALDRQPEMLVEAPGLQTGTARFIDVTRQLMSAAEQETLGTLALAPAGFTAEMARQAVAASPFFLLALLERALLRREGSRYTVHAAVAERYRAGLQDPQAARTRIAMAWSDMAARIEALGIGVKTLRGYREVDREEANLLFAWRHLLQDPSRPGPLWPLVRVLRGYMDVRGRRRDALALFSEADDLLQECPDLELRGWVRECVGLFQIKLDLLDEARVNLGVAQELLARHGPPGSTQAMLWNTFGMLHSFAGDDQAAFEAFRRSAELRAELGDLIGEAQARGNVVMMLTSLERPAEAREQLAAAVERYRAVGHLSGLSLALARLANLMRLNSLGTAAERAEIAREGLELATELGYSSGGMNSGDELAEALIELDLVQDALNALQKAAYWAELEGDPARRETLLARAASLGQPALDAGEAGS